jgi:hypothetical protein
MAVWKTILAYPNYQVSNEGQVRNLRGTVLYHDISHDGYVRVKLSNNGTRKNRKVHILVADAFLDRVPGTDVNHIDRDKQNNHADNLECISHAENMVHWMQQDGRMRNIVGDLIEVDEYDEDPF